MNIYYHLYYYSNDILYILNLYIKYFEYINFNKINIYDKNNKIYINLSNNDDKLILLINNNDNINLKYKILFKKICEKLLKNTIFDILPNEIFKYILDFI